MQDASEARALADLQGLGPKSAANLQAIGITSVEQ